MVGPKPSPERDELRVHTPGHVMFSSFVMGPVRVKALHFAPSRDELHAIAVTRESDGGEEVYTWRQGKRLHRRNQTHLPGWWAQGDSPLAWPQRLVLGEHKHISLPSPLGDTFGFFLHRLSPSRFAVRYLYLQYFRFPHPDTGVETSMFDLINPTIKMQLEHAYDRLLYDDTFGELYTDDEAANSGG